MKRIENQLGNLYENEDNPPLRISPTIDKSESKSQKYSTRYNSTQSGYTDYELEDDSQHQQIIEKVEGQDIKPSKVLNSVVNWKVEKEFGMKMDQKQLDYYEPELDTHLLSDKLRDLRIQETIRQEDLPNRFSRDMIQNLNTELDSRPSIARVDAYKRNQGEVRVENNNELEKVAENIVAPGINPSSVSTYQNLFQSPYVYNPIVKAYSSNDVEVTRKNQLFDSDNKINISSYSAEFNTNLMRPQHTNQNALLPFQHANHLVPGSTYSNLVRRSNTLGSTSQEHLNTFKPPLSSKTMSSMFANMMQSNVETENASNELTSTMDFFTYQSNPVLPDTAWIKASRKTVSDSALYQANPSKVLTNFQQMSADYNNPHPAIRPRQESEYGVGAQSNYRSTPPVPEASQGPYNNSSRSGSNGDMDGSRNIEKDAQSHQAQIDNRYFKGDDPSNYHAMDASEYVQHRQPRDQKQHMHMTNRKSTSSSNTSAYHSPSLTNVSGSESRGSGHHHPMSAYSMMPGQQLTGNQMNYSNADNSNYYTALWQMQQNNQMIPDRMGYNPQYPSIPTPMDITPYGQMSDAPYGYSTGTNSMQNFMPLSPTNIQAQMHSQVDPQRFATAQVNPNLRQAMMPMLPQGPHYPNQNSFNAHPNVVNSPLNVNHPPNLGMWPPQEASMESNFIGKEQDDTLVYQVQFKYSQRNFILNPGMNHYIQIGDFVKVEADRGEDLGVVIQMMNMSEFISFRYRAKQNANENDANEDLQIGRILRLASLLERQQLPEKYHDEEEVVKFCKHVCSTTYMLPMTIIDAEFQYDRHKLTIFYISDKRIDFRELVRDLFAAYKARIWMKKLNNHLANKFVPKPFAKMALATGVQFAAN